ncbi:tRNA-(MS[2]IO[6]A)-hydroxylase (MiaE) [Anatilimnocola aggregata]|uniref:tRNA-(MS[2]IO[6]A)-hydroxylase (MiaE) n=1 Tax=Anatilimnocola aggregata TaxID=2528021 RepID=A0A517YB13_9BACT|nr:tRNA-(ms[2]io[6]A)-hydroxylase [Anatilimnocola aggregata]QDU27428.1 tRNA-(MS[2]IO[6]A)-hydroxylase (MiaE) [Anatilimnocola aggregata]
MLNLQSTTPESWLHQVEANLEELLIDHAHCERKAAACALALIGYYVEDTELAAAMTEIVNEELEHYHLVIDLLTARGLKFRRIHPSTYGSKLHELIAKHEPQRAVDRLLIAGLIEARSCERFGLLRDRLADRELANFYGSLFESEARHHSTYVQLARKYTDEASLRQRLQELAAAEAAILADGDDFPRMHS